MTHNFPNCPSQGLPPLDSSSRKRVFPEYRGIPTSPLAKRPYVRFDFVPKLGIVDAHINIIAKQWFRMPLAARLAPYCAPPLGRRTQYRDPIGPCPPISTGILPGGPCGCYGRKSPPRGGSLPRLSPRTPRSSSWRSGGSLPNKFQMRIVVLGKSQEDKGLRDRGGDGVTIYIPKHSVGQPTKVQTLAFGKLALVTKQEEGAGDALLCRATWVNIDGFL